MNKRVSHIRSLSGITSVVQRLPRKSIEKNEFSFADIVGDINYIEDSNNALHKQQT